MARRGMAVRPGPAACRTGSGGRDRVRAAGRFRPHAGQGRLRGGRRRSSGATGAWYCRVEFERYDLPQPAGAIVACTSLHHVADLGAVLDLVDAALVPGGLLVVVEWARERFDEATARWCFIRLPRPALILAGSTGGTRNGAIPASRGTITAVPGEQRRACMLARTSCVSSAPGSTPGPS